MTAEVLDRVRIDKWLWASRFFKTRSQASRAVTGGRVHVNGSRIKPSRMVLPGDQLWIRRGEAELIVVVQGISDRRGPAVVARELYLETEESIQAREEHKNQRRLSALNGIGPGKRPSKKERRQIASFTRKNG